MGTAEVTDESVLEGYISVRAALKAQSRPIHRIYLRRGKWDAGIAWLERTATAAGIRVERADDATIAAYATGSTHGGVIALVGPRRMQPLEQLGAGVATPFLALLDGIEDPFNFGQAVRALYAAGCHGLILRERNWLSAAGVVARASAGASEWLPAAVVSSAAEAADHCRARGMRVACACLEDAIPLYDADLRGPLLLVIGGEKRGITRSFRDQADLRLAIPYAGEFDQSLGTAAATAVFAFEILRQRRQSR